MRRLLLLLVLLLAAGARPVRAQGGMPDMSKAPPDIQTIWKKVIGGGVPTQAEAKKLQDYMAGHRDAIIAGAKASAAAATKLADSVKSANNAAANASDQVNCPARSPALAGLAATAPSAAGAAQFLDAMKKTYEGQESAAGQHELTMIGTTIADARRLNFMGGVLAANGNAGAAVVVYVDAAQKGGATQRAAWSGLGAALELAADDPHAVTAFRRALAIGPRTAVDVYGLGVAYANLGDMSTGIPLLTEATHLAPKFGMAWDALGRAQSCTGAMRAAIASMQQAQEVDWNGHREAQVFGPESNDDNVEAKKPLPLPPAESVMPPPPAPAFPFLVPSIPSNWLESEHFDVEMIGVANEYQRMLTAIRTQEQAAEPAARRALDAVEAPVGAAGGLELDLNIDNQREVDAATDRVDARMAAKQNLIEAAFGDQTRIIDQNATPRAVAIHKDRDVCTARSRNPAACMLPYCRAELTLAQSTYAAERGAAETMIGGMSELAADYDKAMRAWFLYATNPVTRVRLDADRREQLVNLERFIYTSAQEFGLGGDGENLISECNAAARAAAEVKAAQDAAAKVGKCNPKKLDLDVVVASIYIDCNEFRLGLAGAKLDVRGATTGRHGELFLGVGLPGSIPGVGADIGMQANFDQAGKVTTAGIGVHGSLGLSVVGKYDLEETLNLRSAGPDSEESATFTTGAAFEGDLSAYAQAF